MFLKAIYDELFPLNGKTTEVLTAVPRQPIMLVDEVASEKPIAGLKEIRGSQEFQTKALEEMQGRLKEIQDLLVGLLFINPNEEEHVEKSYPMLTWLREELAILKSLSAGNQLRDQNYARFANKVMAIQSAVLANVETSKTYLEQTGPRSSNELEFQLDDLRSDLTTQLQKSRASNNFVFTLLFLFVLTDIGLFLWTKFPHAIMKLF